MSMRHSFLSAYGLLLKLYPPPFRRRFEPEMLEVAEAAEPGDWPLIFADTGVAIIRCWFEGSPSTAVADPNAYVSLAQSPVTGLGLLQGFVLSVVILAGLYYINSWWPPACPCGGHVVTYLLDTNKPHTQVSPGGDVTRLAHLRPGSKR